jgi:tetratricopeptide (TPR) repeat protein
VVRTDGAPQGLEARPLSQLLPEAFAGGDGGNANTVDPAAERFQLFQAAVAVLRAAAERTPLLLIFDDLHAADPSSLTLLHFVARNLRGLRVAIVGAYRDEEARLSTTVGPLLVDIAREGAYLPLAALAHTDVASLVNAAAGQDASPALLAAIERACEGNPLFVSELLRLMVQRGDFARPSEANPQTLPIPDTVKEVISRRIARLPSETRAVLEIAAVVGRDFATGSVSDILGLSPPVVEDRLIDAERGGLIGATGAQTWRFSHVLVCEALYRDTPRERRADLHLQIAEVLQRGPAGRGQTAAEVAHHRLAALPAGDAALAAAAAREAAERAMGMLAFEDAALLFEKAEQALAASRPADAHAICELKLDAALAHMRAGAVVKGRAACVDAAADARRLGDGALTARAALTYGAELMLAQTDSQLVDLLKEALAALPPGPSGLRAQCLARLAAAQQPAYRLEEPMAMAREAMAMARAVGGDDVLRAVLSHSGSALADYADPTERAAVSEELVRLAMAAGDRVLALRGQSRLLFDYIEMGQLDRGLRAIDAYQRLAHDLRQPRHIWPERLMRAMMALCAGRFDEGERFRDEALEQARGDREVITLLTFAFHSCGRALVTDRPQDLMRAEDDLAQVERDFGGRFGQQAFSHQPREIWRLNASMLHARAGDADAVRHNLSAVPVDSHFLVNDFPVVASIAEAVALSGDATLAALLYERLRPYAGRIITLGRTGMVCVGAVEGALGIYASVLGRTLEAQELLQQAVERERTAGCVATMIQPQRWRERLSGAGVARTVVSPPAPVIGSATRGLAFSLVREGEYWTIAADAQVCRLKGSRGLEMLAELINHPGREFHVLALMGVEAGPVAGEVADGGDAGELLDKDAISDYRARIAELDEEIAEAASWSDTGRLARAREEREALAQEIARGVGLGGRERRAGGAAERARTNVQRRLRGAIRKIAARLPALGAYLERTVRTGAFCSYEPLP